MFLLMGIVLIGSIIMSVYNPYEQMTFANVEKLKSAIEEACLDENNEITILFSMPQNTPAFSLLFSVLPAWIIKSSGDPNYVLYYESFPPGEAIGWEAYHNFNNRLISPLPDGYEGKIVEDVKNYARDVYIEFKNRNPNSVVDAVLINNIILNDKYRSDFIVNKNGDLTNEIFETSSETKNEPSKGFFGYGKWEGNFYKFQNYVGLSTIEKTLIKYQPCGENSLCLKTRNGIYRFPLEMCKGKIKNIQLIYDSRNRGKIYVITTVGVVVVVGASIVSVYVGSIAAVITKALSVFGSVLKFVWKFPLIGKLITIGGTALGVEEGLSFISSQFISFKTSDFYLASPCDIKTKNTDIKLYNSETEETTTIEEERNMRIRFSNCKEGEITGDNPIVCQNVMKYPLYRYNEDGKLEYVRDKNKNIIYHYTCVEKIGDKDDKEIKGNDPPKGDIIDYYNGYCIQIYVDTRPKDFCWTDDPWKREGKFDFDTKILAKILGLDTIKDSTAYIDREDQNDIIVLKRGDIDNVLKRTLEGKITWIWPK